MDLFGSEDDWQGMSGTVPMIRAEYRLRNLRRLSGRIIALHRALLTDLEQERSEYLAWVDSDADARIYRSESREAADEELVWARGETSVLLIGTLVSYGLALLESVLVDVATDRTAEGEKPPGVRGPKLEGWVSALRRVGVELEWDEMLGDLQPWRVIRNAYAHELHFGDGPVTSVNSPRTGTSRASLIS